MIEVYKILHGYYDPEASPCLQQCIYPTTTGHTWKLYQLQSHLNCRKCLFTVRVAVRWNKLPDDVVNAPSVPLFENYLDKHWACQEILYDFKAQLPLSWYSLHHTYSQDLDIIVFQSLRGETPSYLADDCQLIADSGRSPVFARLTPMPSLSREPTLGLERVVFR